MGYSLVNHKSTYNGENAFNTYYIMDRTNLNKFYSLISGKDFISWISSLFVKASDAVTSLRMYPLKELYVTSSTRAYMTMAGYMWNGSKHPRDIKEVTTLTPKVLIARYQVPSAKDFTDFEPFTSMQLYLPFMEFIDLPVNEIRGCILSVYYEFDLSTGMCNAYVEVDNGVDEYVLATKSAKLGVEVAWNATNNAENLRNILTTIATTAISIYTLGASNVAEPLKVAGKIATISKAGVSIANSMQTRYTRGGIANGFTAPVIYPYIIVKKQKLVNVNIQEYASKYGLPLYKDYILSALRGFTIVDEIHLTGFAGALDEELKEIETLLKDGVHL